MTAVIIILILAAIIAAILTIPVTVGAELVYDTIVQGGLYIKYGKIKLYPASRKKREKKEKPEKKKPDESENKERPRRNVTAVAGRLWAVRGEIKETVYAVLGYMFKHLITIRRLDTSFIIGLDDAMNTALAYGLLSGFIYTVLGVVDNSMKLRRHYEDYQPDFNTERIYGEVVCIIRTNIYHAAALAVVLARHALPLYFKIRKGGDENVKSN